ncbi:MAG: ribonuclease HIII, partial [Erysipelotrichaceae bacterium]
MIKSIQYTKQQVEQLLTKYPNNISPTNEPYVLYFLKFPTYTIKIYTSYKAVYNGEFTLENNQYQSNDDQFGSDEVGTGDLFGPICVACAYINNDIANKLKYLDIDDSKKITDEKIRQLAQEIITIVPYSILVLDNEKYNQVILKDNMNKIKAKMHNQAYLNLSKKINQKPKNIIIDQFCTPDLYVRY